MTKSFYLVGLLGVTMMLGACNGAVTAAPTPAVDLNALATQVAADVFKQLTATAAAWTLVPSTATVPPTSMPTLTSTATALLSPTNTFTAAEGTQLLIPFYLVNMANADTCQFSTVAVSSIIYVGPDWRENIKMALNSLFSYKYPQYEITAPDYLLLTNPLYASNLVATETRFDSGILDVYLGGELQRADDCTDLQMRNQIWDTVRFFTNPLKEITDIIIWHNTELLDDLLLPGG